MVSGEWDGWYDPSRVDSRRHPPGWRMIDAIHQYLMFVFTLSCCVRFDLSVYLISFADLHLAE